jgi:serine/threonine protein kinase
VEGFSLAQWLAGTPRSGQEAAHLMETLARAVYYAHQQGIIHRDLKPGNVLLGVGVQRSTVNGPQKTERSLLSSIPKIADFGLAKRLDATAGAEQTRTGEILGTPSYMAPEQAEGKSSMIGPGADIYSLGAILYELLTGRPPFKGESTLDTLLQVRSQEPVAPSRLQPKVPRDLETICVKAMAKSPDRRYGTADELANDLRRFLDGKPILARPVSQVEKLWRWGRRNPMVAALSATILLVLLAGGTRGKGCSSQLVWVAHEPRPALLAAGPNSPGNGSAQPARAPAGGAGRALLGVALPVPPLPRRPPHSGGA